MNRATTRSHFAVVALALGALTLSLTGCSGSSSEGQETSTPDAAITSASPTLDAEIDCAAGYPTDSASRPDFWTEEDWNEYCTQQGYPVPSAQPQYTAQLTTADGYAFTFAFDPPTIVSKADVASAPPGKVNIEAGFTMTMAIDNQTPGHDARVPTVFLHPVWSVSSPLCQDLPTDDTSPLSNPRRWFADGVSTADENGNTHCSPSNMSSTVSDTSTHPIDIPVGSDMTVDVESDGSKTPSYKLTFVLNESADPQFTEALAAPDAWLLVAHHDTELTSGVGTGLPQPSNGADGTTFWKS